MLKWQDSKVGAVPAAIGLAFALVALSVIPAKAGPFNWLNGKNRQQQQQQQQNGSPGFFPFFGGRGNQVRSDSHGSSHASEFPSDDPEAILITNPALGTPTLARANIEATKAAIEQYKGIVARGGWPMVPAKVMKPGSRGPEIEILHRRLEISGDLVGTSIPNQYTPVLTGAVRKFQARHGLPATGNVDSKAMIAALNTPAFVRLAQLQASLKRLQSLKPPTSGRYVLVNIPAAQVEAIDSGSVVLRLAAVVGKPERPTPELSSKIQQINFNPYWHVPRSIIQKDLVPKGREFASRGQDMLAAYHMQAFDAAGNPLDPRQIDWNGTEVYTYSYRQLPWAENSLGFVKINFPNKDSVYMHDTPLKGLFAQAVRFESSGCVRVHNVARLVAWLLQGTPGWNYDRVMSMKQTGEQIDVTLPKPVPVYLAYISAWETPDGQVHFRPDIYGLDGASTTASAY
jgi:L,D-transpeptidase YcbB